MSKCNSSSWGGLLILACVLAVGSTVRAEELARVKTDHVNLRARPDMTAEVVTQLKENDLLPIVVREEGWVGVVPPDSVDVWVHGEFVKDGASTVSKLNLRAGPSINYSIVGTIGRGEPLPVRGQLGEWLKVAPTNVTMWISRDLVDIVSPVKSAASVPVEPAPEPILPPRVPSLPPAEAAPPVGASESASAVASTPARPIAPSAPQIAMPPPADLKLVPLEGQGQSVQRSGELKPAPFLFGRPSPFRLAKKEGVQMVTICYVRGNTAQLNDLMNESLTIFGREYWVQGVKQPVVVLERIERHVP